MSRKDVRYQLWEAFLKEIGLQQRGAAAEIVRVIYNKKRSDDLNQGVVANYRKLLRTPKRPEPQTVWEFALAARKMFRHPFSTRAWCAGPVALFEASHFKEFILVILVAKRKGIPANRLAELCTAVDDFTREKTWRLSNEEENLFQDAWHIVLDQRKTILDGYEDHRIVALDAVATNLTYDIEQIRYVVPLLLADYFDDEENFEEIDAIMTSPP